MEHRHVRNVLVGQIRVGFLQDAVEDGLSSVANKCFLLKWNKNRDELSSTSNVTLHCPNVSRESISKWDWK